MAGVFISYSREDQEYVRRLYRALATAHRDAWVDWEGIPPTAEWRQVFDTDPYQKVCPSLPGPSSV
jgi:hypothetical protein